MFYDLINDLILFMYVFIVLLFYCATLSQRSRSSGAVSQPGSKEPRPPSGLRAARISFATVSELVEMRNAKSMNQ